MKRHRLPFAILFALPFLAACYSLTGQNKTRVTTSTELTRSAYCDLSVSADAGGVMVRSEDGGIFYLAGNVGVPVRTKLRAAHADLAAVLRDNGIDAGAAQIDCP
jgi:hypothetical protein